MDGVLCGRRVGEFLADLENFLSVVGCGVVVGDGCSLGFFDVLVVFAEGWLICGSVGGVFGGLPMLLKLVATALGGSEHWSVPAGSFQGFDGVGWFQHGDFISAVEDSNDGRNYLVKLSNKYADEVSEYCAHNVCTFNGEYTNEVMDETDYNLLLTTAEL
ncbi:hypothetical protein NDU88_006724 [Pleurodeles waltl]|uniref:Uncharacterized protein n=1 Tax=Pleurodeles waltl TaxID=8319 RepID=A0AAV7WYE2_PLEWA|nr:hypothetical protein NDU88_006724 [Pleurodeles waltl]